MSGVASVAKREDPRPWAVGSNESKDPYPRKNLYFVGDDEHEMFDYLIWKANVDAYQMLNGQTATSASEIIIDLIRRAYIRAIVDEPEADRFSAWRREAYEKAGIDPALSRPRILAREMRRLLGDRIEDADQWTAR